MREVGRNEGEAGFTLIETLVTLAVVGFLVVLTSTILHSTSSTLHKISHVDTEAETRSSDLFFLRRILARAQPDFMARDGEGLANFDGLPMQIRFLAPADGREGVFDIVRYELRNDERGRLHVAWRLDRPADQNTLSADDVLPEARIVGLSYFGLDKTSGTSRWIDRWQGREDLPEAIRLGIEIHGRLSEIVTSPILGRSFGRNSR